MYIGRYLSYLLQPKPTEPTHATNGEAKDHRDHLRSIQNSIFSIGDLFKDVGRDGPKSVKFPEKLIKVLELKLENIAMAKDPVYVE
jgi:cob(I)alamin adenosyltransferase